MRTPSTGSAAGLITSSHGEGKLLAIPDPGHTCRTALHRMGQGARSPQSRSCLEVDLIDATRKQRDDAETTLRAHPNNMQLIACQN